MEAFLLFASFAVILAGALRFTNAVEWIGHRLGLGEGAVGSLLAAVGTAMPETLIAIVALVGATKSEDVAVGAIVGAPFLLATLAMGLVGLTAYLYRDRRLEAIVLSLILAPLATELPEKVNSFFWVREGKDPLALGNITGAMVFQSVIPVGIGLIFTDWDLTGNAALSVGLGLAGGVIAYWALRLRDRFELPAVLVWIALYAAFIVVV